MAVDQPSFISRSRKTKAYYDAAEEGLFYPACLIINPSTGSPISSFGGGTQYDEGDDISSAPTGTLAMFRDDSDLAAPGTLDASGNLLVNVAAGGTSGFVDDSAFTSGTTEGSVSMGFYSSTIDSVDDGDGGAFAMTQFRGQHVHIVDGAGGTLGASGGTPFIVQGSLAGGTNAYAQGTAQGILALAGVRNDSKASVSSTGDFGLNPLSTDEDGGLIRMAEIQTALELIDDSVIEDFAGASPDKALAVGGLTKENTTISGRVPVVFKADRAGRQIVVSQPEMDRPYISDGGIDVDEMVWTSNPSAGGSPSSGEFEPDDTDGYATTEIILHDTDLSGTALNGLLDQIQAGDEILVRSASALESLTGRHSAYRVTSVSFALSRYTLSVESLSGGDAFFSAGGEYQFTFLLASRRGTMLRKSDGTELGTSADPVRTDPTGTTTQPVSAASLPLPSGAATEAKQDDQETTLNAIQTAVEIMDDWDESNRAAVNLISGQAGVQGGSGASTASTQRVAIATDANEVSVESSALAVDGGDVNATGLTSDATWTKLVTLSNVTTAHRIVIQNTSDAPIEVALNDSPTDTSGTDIDFYLGPRSILDLNLKADGLTNATDIEVRKYDTDPVDGFVFGAVFGV